MNLKKTFKKYAHIIGIALLTACWPLLLLYSQVFVAMIVAAMLITGGVIETYVIDKTGLSLSKFYYPILPKQIDLPLSIVVPVSLVVKMVLIETWEKNHLNCWWVGCAFVVIWVASHLCSRE